MISNYTLKNGIRLVVNEISGVYSVSCGILVGAGSRLETETENGISHFIEHVNFKGTKTRTSFDISRQMDDLGSQINAYTAKDYTCYYVKSLSEHVAESFEILSDLFINSAYDEEELNKERGVIVEEINMYEDTPDEVCLDELSSAYFGKDGYGRTILGTERNVKGFTRDDIQAYKNKYYTTDNIVLSFAGNVSFDTAKELCEKYFGGIQASFCAVEPQRNTVNLCNKLVREKPIEQAHIGIALNSCSMLDDDYLNWSVISSALGSGMSSRLFQAVREKLGLCYSIFAFSSGYTDCGALSVYAGVSAKLYEKAYEAIISELEKFKKEGMSEDEFKRNREQMKSAFVMAQESTSSQMMLFGKYLLFRNQVFDFSARINGINALTLNAANSVIFDKLDIKNQATAVVGKNVKNLQ